MPVAVIYQTIYQIRHFNGSVIPNAEASILSRVHFFLFQNVTLIVQINKTKDICTNITHRTLQ